MITRTDRPGPGDGPEPGLGALCERLMPAVENPIAAGSTLCADSGDPYLLYERDGSVLWAEGEALVVEVTPRAVQLSGRATGEGARVEQIVPESSQPLTSAGAVLDAATAAGRTAHGWVGFELAHTVHYRVPAAKNDGPSRPLARFVLPEREIRLSPDGAVLRAADSAGLDALEARLSCAVAGQLQPPDERIQVDLDEGAARYRSGVAASVRAIRDGRLEKVVLSRSVRVPGPVDLPATYLAGRRAHEPARSFLLRHGDWEAAGFSPEIVARVGADRTVSAQPLAGTRALTGDSEADSRRRGELYRDAKEVFEHAISVRLAQDELASVCAPGTVRTEDFMTVRERGSVQHLASELRGVLGEGVSRWEALAALFPAVTASGIPKPAAVDLIRRAERDERGLYSGAVVTLDPDGALDASLVLRAVLRRDGRTWLRAGAGVVAGSTPARELEETREKLRAVSGHLVPARAADPNGTALLGRSDPAPDAEAAA